jgi:hypothetical protein
MKSLFLVLLAAAALSGCAYYPTPYGYGYGYPAAYPAYGYAAPSVSIGFWGGDGRWHDRGYRR